MCPHVDDQLAGLDKSLIADVALVWPLSRMDAHMAMQFAAVLESSTANVAFVGTLLGVDASVDLQVFLNAKHLMAEFAFERSLARVCAVVTDLEEWSKQGPLLLRGSSTIFSFA